MDLLGPEMHDKHTVFVYHSLLSLGGTNECRQTTAILTNNVTIHTSNVCNVIDSFCLCNVCNNSCYVKANGLTHTLRSFQSLTLSGYLHLLVEPEWWSGQLLQTSHTLPSNLLLLSGKQT